MPGLPPRLLVRPVPGSPQPGRVSGQCFIATVVLVRPVQAVLLTVAHLAGEDAGVVHLTVSAALPVAVARVQFVAPVLAVRGPVTDLPSSHAAAGPAEEAIHPAQMGALLLVLPCAAVPDPVTAGRRPQAVAGVAAEAGGPAEGGAGAVQLVTPVPAVNTPVAQSGRGQTEAATPPGPRLGKHHLESQTIRRLEHTQTSL